MTGTIYIDRTDPGRPEVLGKKKGSRRIAVRFYYPGIADEKIQRSDGLTEKKRKWLGKREDFALYESRVALYEGLKVKEGPYPLILFNHGYGGFTEQNNDLCSFLADHGYIVASVGHSYEAVETVYEDGTSVTYGNPLSLYFKLFKPFLPALFDLIRLRKKALTDEEALAAFEVHQNRYEAFDVERVEEWRKDDLFALAKIREMNEDEGSPLYHRIDFSKGIGAAGHSYGGALAYAHCLLDEDIVCGVNLDGGIFGNFGDTVNRKPFLQIVNPANVNVVSRTRLYHEGPVHYMIFRDVEHNGFTDMKLVTKKGSDVGSADPEFLADNVNGVNLAFFDRYLKEGDTGNSAPLPVDQKALLKYDIL